MAYTLENSASAQSNTYNTASVAPVPAQTLVRAISSIEELNKRLTSLSQQAISIAQTVGGPYPVSAQGKEPSPPQSAMQKLNCSIDDAHSVVSDIEQALGAMQRALGS